VLGCDGASGVVRDQIGARYVGRSDPRPNFNVVFRALDLDTHLGPAVQYWVVGGRTTGLIGRLDLAGIWWAIMPGIEAGYGQARDAELITDLIGATPAGLEVLAARAWHEFPGHLTGPLNFLLYIMCIIGAWVRPGSDGGVRAGPGANALIGWETLIAA
jgi:hypothetical protein